MEQKDLRNIFAGGALIAIGAFLAIYALLSLRLGTISRMGPGMMPFALSLLLTALGAVIFVPALSRPAEKPIVADGRSFLFISLSIMAFALLVSPFGLVPAIFAMTFIASRADSRLSMAGTALAATALSVLAVVTFVLLLNLQLPIFDWPW